MIIERKYRPRNIEEFCDNNIQNIVKDKIINTENDYRFILINGEIGTGKSALAYIIARYYTDENNIVFTTATNVLSSINKLLNESAYSDKKSVIIIEEPEWINRSLGEKLVSKLKELNDNVIVIMTYTDEDKIAKVIMTALDNESSTLKLKTSRLDAKSNYKMIVETLLRYNEEHVSDSMLTDKEIYDIVNNNDCSPREYLLKVQELIANKA